MPDILVSPATAITIAIGVAISLVYLRAMGLALRRAAIERDVPDDGQNDAYVHSFVGAIIAVAASSLTIALYGAGPQFLYLGVLLALASPIAVAYTFWRELKD